MHFLKSIADNTSRNSYATQMRQRRFQLFLSLLDTVPKPIRLLDIGGTQKFWEMMEFTDQADIHITLLNMEKPDVRYGNFVGIAGDATNLGTVADNAFDVVFSNSVIEHVGDFAAQQRMAREVQRVGQRYFVQTPNYFFPMEPHFLIPGFQWFPINLRAWLLSRRKLGWYDRIPDRMKAKEFVQSIRLLRKKEVLALFPKAILYEERLLGLTKSFIVYQGWP